MDTSKINRIEYIDHTKCLPCKGKGIVVAENYKLSGTICRRCGGTGTFGRLVLLGGPAYNQEDNKKVEFSLQDDGRTLKIFVSEEE